MLLFFLKIVTFDSDFCLLPPPARSSKRRLAKKKISGSRKGSIAFLRARSSRRKKRCPKDQRCLSKRTKSLLFNTLQKHKAVTTAINESIPSIKLKLNFNFNSNSRQMQKCLRIFSSNRRFFHLSKALSSSSSVFSELEAAKRKLCHSQSLVPFPQHRLSDADIEFETKVLMSFLLGKGKELVYSKEELQSPMPESLAKKYDEFRPFSLRLFFFFFFFDSCSLIDQLKLIF